jgi:hypothetical protein
MSRHGMDADTAETLAGVVRLLRRAAELVWAAVDADDAGSPRQVLGLGIDLAADEARNLLPDAIPVDGPVPVGDEPTGLLRSAEQLLRRVTTPRAGTGLYGLRAQVADLVWEANTCVGGRSSHGRGATRRQRRAGPRDAPRRNTRSRAGHGEEQEPARRVSGRTMGDLAFHAGQPIGIGSNGAAAGHEVAEANSGKAPVSP